MVRMYDETGDVRLAPSVQSYNVLINAWSKSNDPNALSNAEKILSEMLSRIEAERSHRAGDGESVGEDGDGSDSYELKLKPDAVTFSTIMDMYAKSNHPRATERCEELFQMMVRRRFFTLWSLIPIAYVTHAFSRHSNLFYF